MAAFLLLAVGAVVSRRPDALLNAQFFVEDGRQWYAGAYNIGWDALVTPYSGYLVTFSRLVAAVTVFFPLLWAPTVFFIAALAVQVLPVAYLLSSRLDSSFPSLTARMALALLYVGVPNTPELDVNLTNAMWHLTIVAFLIIWSLPPRTRLLRGIEYALVGVSALSGPFGIFLLPTAAMVWWRRRSVWHRNLFAIFAVGDVIQLIVIVTHFHQRLTEPLGAGLVAFCKIFGGEVILASFLGRAPLWQEDTLLPISITVLALVLIAWAAWRGPDILRLWILFAALSFAAALWSPGVVISRVPAWVSLMSPSVGGRYYLFPILAWFGVLMWLAAKLSRGWAKRRSLRTLRLAAAEVVIVGLVAGVANGWEYTGEPNLHWSHQVARFHDAANGAHVAFPVNPDNGQYTMILIKHG
ncbi:MAG: hypothetical protein WB867_00280 [Candidatus Dormiibacterota bacterium]